MARGPVQQTRFPAVSVSSLTLATSCICTQLVKFKSSATLVKTAPCQLGFLILLCYILLISNYREISDLGLNVLTSRTDL